MIEVKKSKTHGRGVFATERIYPHKIVDQGPVLIYHGAPKALKGYLVEWPGHDKGALMMGKATFLNHSTEDANVVIEGNRARREYRIHAIRRIEKGDELLLDYKDAAP